VSSRGNKLTSGRINPLLKYRSHTENLTPSNAESIVSHYDLVLDCTDHPSSRYLISDICILLEKPLISASALRTDGQLIVLNCPPSPQGSQYQYAGPCYRCIYPTPPPPESVLSCGEGGILGPVVGVMGVLQALEAIRIIAHGLHRSIDQVPLHSAVGGEKSIPTLTLFSTTADEAPSFRNVRMRRRRKDCFACSAASTLTLESLKNGSIDYVQFCGIAAPPSPLKPEERISALEYSQIQRQVNGAAAADHVLLDVRQREHFDVANIPGAINLPYSTFQQQMRQRTTNGMAGDDRIDFLDPEDTRPMFVVCRVGNDSQSVVRQLKDAAAAEGHAEQRPFVDISGGMRAWKRDVDPTMPFV
jgi:adenylyltransferase and sulfurtransferase